jgi:signal transduction histidine kinase
MSWFGTRGETDSPVATPKAQRSRAAYVGLLLVLTLGLSGALAYQAIAANRSHEQVALEAVRDNANIAAWAFAGATRRMLNDKLIWFGIDVLEAGGAKDLSLPLQWDTVAAQAGAKEWSSFKQANLVFRADLKDGKVSFQGYTTAETKEWIKSSLPEWTKERWKGDLSPGLVFPPESGDPVIYAFYPAAPKEPEVMFGMAFHATVLEELLSHAFESNTLLPEALTGGLSNAELLSARIVTPGGKAVYAAGEWFASEFVGIDTLGLRFGSLTSRVRVRPEVAESLVIGGFPRSRLPSVLGLMALAGGLVVVAIFQLKREGELARLRADFVSGVSHELRTPLAQIRMFAETLSLGRVRSDEEQARSLEIIVNESQRLSHQVDNVLLFSRAERGRLRLEPMKADLSRVVGQVIEGFEPLANAAGVSVTSELTSPLEAMIDEDGIRQALLNLLDNAVKYGPSGQVIRVGAGRAPGGRAVLWVEDEGPGVPDEVAKQVFEPYFRLEHHRHSAVAGSGIGLAVVAEIVRGHGGDVRVERANGKGARFVVTLPRQVREREVAAGD